MVWRSIAPNPCPDAITDYPANVVARRHLPVINFDSMALPLRDALPNLAEELETLLAAADRPDLTQQVSELKIVERCRCGDDFCATFYTQPKPHGAYGAGHENVELEPESGMIILDVVRGSIACVEVLNRDDVRRTLNAALP